MEGEGERSIEPWPPLLDAAPPAEGTTGVACADATADPSTRTGAGLTTNDRLGTRECASELLALDRAEDSQGRRDGERDVPLPDGGGRCSADPDPEAEGGECSGVSAALGLEALSLPALMRALSGTVRCGPSPVGDADGEGDGERSGWSGGKPSLKRLRAVRATAATVAAAWIDAACALVATAAAAATGAACACPSPCRAEP